MQNNRLGFARDGSEPFANQSYGGFGGGRQNAGGDQDGFADESRRGYFLPPNARLNDAPVRLGGPQALQDRNRRRDIAPTLPGVTSGFGAPAQSNNNNANRPMALPVSNEVRPQRAAARAQPATTQQQ